MSKLSATSDGVVDFIGGWDNVMGPLRAVSDGNVLDAISTIGVVLMVVAVLGFLWRGGKGGLKTLVIPLVLGATLAAPNLLIPLLLNIFQFIVNFFVALLG